MKNVFANAIDRDLAAFCVFDSILIKSANPIESSAASFELILAIPLKTSVVSASATLLTIEFWVLFIDKNNPQALVGAASLSAINISNNWLYISRRAFDSGKIVVHPVFSLESST